MIDRSLSRRQFVKTGTAAAGVLAVNLPLSAKDRPRKLHEVRIGLVGCGGRGTGAAANALASSEGVRLVAMGDVFMRKVKAGLENIKETEVGEKVNVDADSCYAGLDAYKKVIHHPDVDLVINATPPGFRPLHLAETVAAGKHSFIEKPCCVDPAGYRSILESGKIARQKKLAIATGTMFRRSNNYMAGVQAIHDGAIGDILFAQARYCSGGIWYRRRREGASDVEYQMDNWYHFLWLCGDQIVEQAVHNIDAINWAMGGPPALAYGLGGQRLRPADSEIYDCLSVDYEYPNGATLSFMCRQQPGKNEVSNKIVGTKGVAEIRPFGITTIKTHDGKQVLRARYKGNAYVQEHTDLIASLREGKPIMEVDDLADSSLTAVMGRMAAYSGERVSWEFVTEQSQLDLMPKDLALDGSFEPRPVPVPGKYKLV